MANIHGALTVQIYHVYFTVMVDEGSEGFIDALYHPLHSPTRFVLTENSSLTFLLEARTLSMAMSDSLGPEINACE